MILIKSFGMVVCLLQTSEVVTQFFSDEFDLYIYIYIWRRKVEIILFFSQCKCNLFSESMRCHWMNKSIVETFKIIVIKCIVLIRGKLVEREKIERPFCE